MSNSDGSGSSLSKLSGKARLGSMNVFQGNRGKSKVEAEFLSKSKRFVTYNWMSRKLDGDPSNEAHYCVEKDKIYIPGGLISPVHEIAHIIEMNDNNRIVMNDFGMKDQKPSSSANYWLPALAREARVRMIQMMMLDDHPHQNAKTMGTINPLNNVGWLGVTNKIIGTGKFKNLDDVIDWVEVIQRTTLRTWNMDRIYHVWQEKVEFIENYFETSKSN